MPDLFLSHSSSDVEAVRRLRAYLERGGYSCWMAPDDVSSAKPWAEQIVDAIRDCRVMVVVLSGRSVDSDHVSREVGLAMQAGRPVLPVRIEQVLLSGSLAYLLHLVQWVDAFPGPIDTHIDQIGVRVADLAGPMGGAASAPAGGGAPPGPGGAPPSRMPPPPGAGDPAAAGGPPFATRPAGRTAPPAVPPAPWSGPPARPAGGTAARASGLSIVLRLAIAGGGVAVIVGSLLPWAEVTLHSVTVAVLGIERDGLGWLTAALGLALILLATVASGGRTRLAAVTAVVVALAVVAISFVESMMQPDLPLGSPDATLSTAVGLDVLATGAIVSAIAGLVLAVLPRRSPADRGMRAAVGP